MNKKIIMAAGGSGGHIYPALALAKAMQEKGNEVIFIGSLDRMEKDVIPTSGFPFIGLDIKTTRGSIIQKFKSLLSLFNAYFKCLKLLNFILKFYHKSLFSTFYSLIMLSTYCYFNIIFKIIIHSCKFAHFIEK